MPSLVRHTSVRGPDGVATWRAGGTRSDANGSVYSRDYMRLREEWVHSRRRRWIVVVIAIGVIGTVWGPALVATRYTHEAQRIDFWSRPDKGWRFLFDAVRESRSAKLGTEGRALATANHTWRSVDRVELVYLEGPVTVPIPNKGEAIPAHRRTVNPRSPFTWFVYGRLGSRTSQIVGLLDAKSGRVIWDLRRVRSQGVPV